MQLSANNPFSYKQEPDRSCLLYLRKIILNHSADITEAWKFNTPFYYYKKKWLCFISYDPKTSITYVSFVNGFKMQHPKLLAEGRKKMKIFKVDVNADMDLTSLKRLLKMASALYD